MDGQELTPWLLRYAYERACFPMTMADGSVEWFQPRSRALFPLGEIHLSHSLAKRIKTGSFEVRFDTEFESVIRNCMRPGDNWISADFVRTYGQCHMDGWAHCCECWDGRELVGGVYGLAVGSCFCAESMFHRKTDASKVALWAMVERCRELGFSVFDAQVMNPHLASLGAYEVSHDEYLALLEDALARTTAWSAPSGG